MEYSNIQYDFPEISKNDKFALFDKLKSEETKSMNFEQYRKKVYDELSTIETEIISNLAKHDKEFMEMFKNFEESDEILNKLEENLLFFKNKLSDINNDMKMLQNKSSEITIKLKFTLPNIIFIFSRLQCHLLLFLHLLIYYFQ